MTWEIKKLGDVCEIIAGQSPEGKYYNNIGKGTPFYQGKKKFTNKFLGKPTTWTTKTTKEAQKGDVLMSVRAPVGPINFSTQKICIGRGLAAIRASNKIDKDFLFNFLLKYKKELIGNTGAVFNSINRTQIKNIKIPLPSLPEQKRIVSILDEVFEKLSKAKENTEQNLNNAKEVFEIISGKIFEKIDIDKNRTILGDVCEKITQGPNPKLKNISPEENCFILKTKDFYNDVVLYDKCDQVNIKTINEWKRFLLKDNDLIVALVGVGSIGKSNIFREQTGKEYIFTRATGLIRVDKDHIISKYFHYYLLSSLGKELIEKGIGGTTGQLVIKTSYFKEAIVPIPDKVEQEQIVSTLNALSEQTKQLEQICTQKLTNLEELKQSILQKAFNGELIEVSA